jgi:hypothetical protein
MIRRASLRFNVFVTSTSSQRRRCPDGQGILQQARSEPRMRTMVPTLVISGFTFANAEKPGSAEAGMLDSL